MGEGGITSECVIKDGRGLGKRRQAAGEGCSARRQGPKRPRCEAWGRDEGSAGHWQRSCLGKAVRLLAGSVHA